MDWIISSVQVNSEWILIKDTHSVLFNFLWSGSASNYLPKLNVYLAHISTYTVLLLLTITLMHIHTSLHNTRSEDTGWFMTVTEEVRQGFSARQYFFFHVGFNLSAMKADTPQMWQSKLFCVTCLIVCIFCQYLHKKTKVKLKTKVWMLPTLCWAQNTAADR